MDTPSKILMVDDDWVSRKLVTHSLKSGGFEVHCLEDSLRTLETAREIQPDLIMLDLMMPMKSGYATLLELKDDEDLKGIPVVIMSAKSQDEEIASCLSNGAADYLVKPVSLKELQGRLKKLVEAGDSED